MATLFTAATLHALSGREVSESTAEAIHTWVEAILTGEVGELTDPVVPGIAAVALELGKAAVPSPGGATTTSVGPFSVSYGSSRRQGEAALSPDQRARLRRAAGKAQAFSVPTAVPFDEDWEYVGEEQP